MQKKMIKLEKRDKMLNSVCAHVKVVFVFLVRWKVGDSRVLVVRKFKQKYVAIFVFSVRLLQDVTPALTVQQPPFMSVTQGLKWKRNFLENVIYKPYRLEKAKYGANFQKMGFPESFANLLANKEKQTTY